MSTSAWSNATGKMKPSYAELLRRAKEEKSADGNGRSGSIDPGNSSTKLAPTTNRQLAEARQIGASEASKATTEPPYVQTARSAASQATDRVGSGSSTAITSSDRNGQNRSSASSSSPHAPVTGVKPAPANVWELRKLQKAEAAAALTAPRPASANAALGIQSKRASTQEETAAGGQGNLDKLPIATSPPVRAEGTTATHNAALKGDIDNAQPHTNTPSRSGRGRVECEEPRGATSIAYVAPQSTKDASVQTKSTAISLSAAERKSNQEGNVSGAGTTDNAWLDKISMLNGAQELPSAEGRTTAVSGLPASVTALDSSTLTRRLPQTGERLPQSVASSAGGDVNDRQGLDRDKSRRAIESPERNQIASERECRDSDRVLRAQKKDGRVGVGENRMSLHGMSEGADRMPSSTSAFKTLQRGTSTEPAGGSGSTGEADPVRDARMAVEVEEVEDEAAVEVVSQVAKIGQGSIQHQYQWAMMATGTLKSAVTALEAPNLCITLIKPRLPAKKTGLVLTRQAEPTMLPRLPTWQQPGPYFHDAHPGQTGFGSTASTYFPMSMRDDPPNGAQATVWTSPRPEPGALHGRPFPDYRIVPPESPVSRLVHQVEFYFSPQNLYKDSFLRQQMDPASGWVPLALIQSFKRVRMLSQDVDLLLSSDPVLERLRHNPHVEMDEEGRRLRKRYGWQEWVVQPDGLMLAAPVMSAPVGPGVLGGFPPHEFGHLPPMRLDSEGGPEQQALYVQPQQGYWLPHNAQLHSGYYVLPASGQPMSGYAPPHIQHWQPAMGGMPAFPPPVPPTHFTTFDSRAPAYQNTSSPVSEFGAPSNQASVSSVQPSPARRGSALAPSPDRNLSQATSPSIAEQHSMHFQSTQQQHLQPEQSQISSRQSDQVRPVLSQHHDNLHSFVHPAQDMYHAHPFATEGALSPSADTLPDNRVQGPNYRGAPRGPDDQAASAAHTPYGLDGQPDHLMSYQGADGQHASYAESPAQGRIYPSSSVSYPAARSSVDASSSAFGTPPLDSSMVSASSATSTSASQRRRVPSSESPAHTGKDGSDRVDHYGDNNRKGSQQEAPPFTDTAKSLENHSNGGCATYFSQTQAPATLTKDIKHLNIGGNSGSDLSAPQAHSAPDAKTSAGGRHQRADEEDDDDEDVGLGVIAAEGLGGLVGRGA
ncbi:hypothetical protein BCV69DRAFT_277645 [Microstroma glucosiphilum]|uniref:HTH La-type RNA-binding domain-containing protein n=1 Tax=Pseudomicrostroma glucosiphilum TaxID=1684307 RepID=A0A316U599_9BASI|nr:hypothetical protein BCV69DRAFT_277645 [Pseudomicrostroma glucosiphilum]PWN20406.1 hypothetical protein BCV69DRAFT_277645 [Pseudomicrostroma glucosiphilum]